MRRKFFKIILIALVAVVFLFAITGYRAKKAYNNIFRLSYEEIEESIKNAPPQCKKFKDCKLEPGDILIRRYVTNVTNSVDKIFNPYFLHSAVYIGNDELFEVVGNGENPENQIAITKLSKSDWYHSDMVNFIVLRPKDYKNKFEKITENFKNIANDPEYLFGIYNENKKTASCADIIFKTLEKEGIISSQKDAPAIITPDYLFWALLQNKENIEVFGFNIIPKI